MGDQTNNFENIITREYEFKNSHSCRETVLKMLPTFCIKYLTKNIFAAQHSPL